MWSIMVIAGRVALGLLGIVVLVLTMLPSVCQKAEKLFNQHKVVRILCYLWLIIGSLTVIEFATHIRKIYIP
ncbi:MAG: hypothetical protein HFJ28_03335 [Clostridia bacterium]|jgi:hypothetical protein|nr:hypothetical protein [Clostridia bacterium]